MVAGMLLKPEEKKEGFGQLRNFSFGNHLKLKTSKEYSEVFNSGKKIIGIGIIIYYKPETQLKTGIIVSRKVDKRAVIRNRTKRILREVFRLHKPDLPGQYVIIAKNKILKMKYLEILSDFNQAIKKIRKQYDN